MSLSGAAAVEALARRDRHVVLAGLLGVSGLAWLYTIALSEGMPHADAQLLLLPHQHSWTAADLALTFGMWLVMMVAMMAPTAAPMLLALARIDRAQRPAHEPLAPAAAFLLGYLLVWSGFSLLATLAQGWLRGAELISAAGASRSALFGGALLLVAGVFQLTPLKQACLRHCRSPLAFLMTAWRPGLRGAGHMGMQHGLYCVGCCWALMGLMFFAGTMNLLWIAALAVLMLAEKALPGGRWLGRVAGAGLAVWGLCLLGLGSINA